MQSLAVPRVNLSNVASECAAAGVPDANQQTPCCVQNTETLFAAAADHMLPYSGFASITRGHFLWVAGVAGGAHDVMELSHITLMQ